MARTSFSLKKAIGQRILRQAEGFHVFHTGIHCHYCSPFLTLGFDPFLVTLNGYYLVSFWAHWMLNVRPIDVR